MKNTCTLLSPAAIAARIILMKTQWNIGTENFNQVQKFLDEVKRCPISGKAFSLLVKEYKICLILAENQTLTPQQIIALIDCDAVKEKEHTGNEQMFKKLLANVGNNENSRKHLTNKQEIVTNQYLLTGE